MLRFLRIPVAIAEQGRTTATPIAPLVGGLLDVSLYRINISVFSRIQHNNVHITIGMCQGARQRQSNSLVVQRCKMKRQASLPGHQQDACRPCQSCSHWPAASRWTGLSRSPVQYKQSSMRSTAGWAMQHNCCHSCGTWTKICLILDKRCSCNMYMQGCGSQT